MSRKKINLLYIRPVVGHPEAGDTVRVELTEQVQALLDQGLALDLGDADDAQVPVEHAHDDAQPPSQPAAPPQQPDERPADTAHLNGPADPPTNPDEHTAPDGSTKLPAKKTPRKAPAKKTSDAS